MRSSRANTWPRLRVYFGAFLLVVFAFRGLLIYASSLADRQSGRGLSAFVVWVRCWALSVFAAIIVGVISRRVARDE